MQSMLKLPMIILWMYRYWSKFNLQIRHEIKAICYSDIVSRWTHIQVVRNTYFKICQKIFFVSMNKLLGLGGRQVEKDKHLM